MHPDQEHADRLACVAVEGGGEGIAAAKDEERSRVENRGHQAEGR
jgi:hypothetical protein